MWVFLNDAYLSIVAHESERDNLLVRGRFKGDIEAVFPTAITTETPERDYRYRAVIPRGIVAHTLSDRALLIDYPNFKGSVKDRLRHQVYLDVWRVMESAQRLWQATVKRTRR